MEEDIWTDRRDSQNSDLDFTLKFFLKVRTEPDKSITHKLKYKNMAMDKKDYSSID